MAWTPHEYQLRAVKLLIQQAAGGLFLDPGLGKTSIALAAFKLLKQQGLAQRMLIVAPLRPVYSVWPAELTKWSDFNTLTYTILHGDKKMDRLEQRTDIYLINPEGLLWLFKDGKHNDFLKTIDCLLIDEATTFKNSQSQRFKLIKPYLERFARRWILTGTPMPNGLEDLFGEVYLLDGGRALGRYITHFRNQYFIKSPFNVYDWKPRVGAFDEVVERIRPLILQLSAEDYLAMPELNYITVPVTLPPKAMEQYEAIEDVLIASLEDGTIVAANAAVAGGKCRQIANGAVYDEKRQVHPVHSAKLDALESLLNELSGHPVLLLYEFQHDANRIQFLLGQAVPHLSAGLPPAKMQRLIDDFNAGEVPVLLGHPASMGHGLNLQGSCHHVIWFGIPWNLEWYDQAIARVYRQGQRNTRVFVYHLAASGTLDTKVLAVLQAKDRSQQALLKALS